MEEKTYSIKDTPKRNKNSTPLARSYSSFSTGIEDVVLLGVCSTRDETGNNHCAALVLGAPIVSSASVTVFLTILRVWDLYTQPRPASATSKEDLML